MYKSNGSVSWKQMIFVVFNNFFPNGFLNNDIVRSAYLTRLAILSFTSPIVESSEITNVIHFFLLFWIIKDDIILLSWLNNTMIRFS